MKVSPEGSKDSYSIAILRVYINYYYRVSTLRCSLAESSEFLNPGPGDQKVKI